jgi:carbon monoxide dehydrogenase subunit G
MKVLLDGDFLVSTTPAETFDFITTPEKFAPILPYFKELRSVSGKEFGVILEVGVPQIRGKADVTARRIEEVVNQQAVYELNGRHALGMIDARMSFIIEPIAEGSKVSWTSEGVVSGTLASLAQGILLPLAKRQIKSLVVSVQKALGAVEDPSKDPSGLLKRGLTSVRGLFGASAAANEKSDGTREPSA